MTAAARRSTQKQATPLVELVGVVSRIAYAKEDDRGWFVILQLKDGQSAKGNANPEEFVPGLTYRFFGRYGKAKPPYPPAFEFQQYVKQLPHSREGVVQYLIRYAAGIGPVYACQLWDAYGTDAVKIVRSDPERVAREVPSIPVGKLTQASQALQSLAATEDVRIELTNLLDKRGFVRTLIDTLIQKWGIHAAERVKRDPFTLLVNRFPSCGFARCDALYRDLGLPLDRLKRQFICLWRAFQEDSSGHTWFSLQIAEATIRANISGVTNEPNWKRAVRLGMRAGWLKGYIDEGGNRWITEAKKAEAENSLAKSLAELSCASGKANWPDPLELTDATEHQRETAKRCFSKGPVAILAGTPGTGKTTLAAMIIRELSKSIGIESVVVCAPTGKAAVRIQESLEARGLSGLTIGTIHRVLTPERSGRDGNGWQFHFNASNKLPFDLVVIDEGSMLDVETAASLFESIRPGSLVLIVGDPYQLPPVGHGATLRDLIASGVAGYGELTEVKRNDGDALRACRLIKDGGRPRPSDSLDLSGGKNWKHWEMKSAAQSLATLERMVSGIRIVEVSPGREVDPLWDVQVIVALNDKGDLNRRDVSKRIQQILNPSGETVEGVQFRTGDKVICTENCGLPLFENNWQDDLVEWNSRTDDERDDWVGECVANGEIGQVLSVERRWFVVQFNSPRRVVLAPLVGKQAYAGNFQLGYAITFHKSQGSQWPIVILLIDKAADRMASRELWYTGISRFEKLVVTIGELATLHRQCKRVALVDRKTFLKERIQQYAAGYVPF